MIVDAVKTFDEIKKSLHNSSDLVSRNVQFFDRKVTICYIVDIIDNILLNDTLIEPMLEYQPESDELPLQTLKEKILSANKIESCTDINSAIDKLVAGNALILIDGENEIVACDIEKITVRAVSEPPTSVVIKGPREGFNESIKYNLALIRKRVKSNDLVVKNLEIGKLTKTQVSVVYFNSVVDKKIVKQILKKLNNIQIDGVVDSHYLIS